MDYLLIAESEIENPLIVKDSIEKAVKEARKESAVIGREVGVYILVWSTDED